MTAEQRRAESVLAGIRGAIDRALAGKRDAAAAAAAVVAEAVADEREACARVAEARQSHQGNEIADAIRARGQS